MAIYVSPHSKIYFLIFTFSSCQKTFLLFVAKMLLYQKCQIISLYQEKKTRLRTVRCLNVGNILFLTWWIDFFFFPPSVCSLCIRKFLCYKLQCPLCNTVGIKHLCGCTLGVSLLQVTPLFCITFLIQN